MMTHRQALEVIARHRADKIVIAAMTSGGIWPELSDTPLDFPYLPSAMGQGPSLGLGMALAQLRDDLAQQLQPVLGRHPGRDGRREET